ncbi:MAG: restriction endonuclease, partial [Campylobacterota bacterium]|nr:restriction endonuclease [Campylobacterota bacterium]
MKNSKLIYEYSYIQNEDLKNSILSNSSLQKYFKLDFQGLKARQYCGIISLDSQNVYILPKISKRDNEHNLDIFIYMLMYSYDIKLENEDIASCKNESSNILEVFI